MFVVRIKTVQSEFAESDDDGVHTTPCRQGDYAEIFSGLGFSGYDEPDSLPAVERNGDDDSRMLILNEENERNFVINDALHPDDDHSPVFEILLDPHNAFGDGRHPTTEICIHMLGRLLSGISSGEKKSIRMLDAGTGSGILSILAARMGIVEIDAVDLSWDAVRSAVSNARLNRCEFRILCADIGNFEFSERYDVIMANLVTDVLLENMKLLENMLADSGIMITSGISVMSGDRARESFKNQGFTVMDNITWRGWMGFELRRS